MPRLRRCICRICIRRILDCLRWILRESENSVSCPTSMGLSVPVPLGPVPYASRSTYPWRSAVGLLEMLAPLSSSIVPGLFMSFVESLCFATYDIKRRFAILRILTIWWSRTILFENVERLYVYICRRWKNTGTFPLELWEDPLAL